MADKDMKTGRFTPGNKAAKGNPYTKKAAELRKALYTSVTAQDIKRIVDNLKEQALAGDLKAISLLFDRLLGTIATGIDVLERMEKLEQMLTDTPGDSEE